MDRRSWLWRRKSSEKSPSGETESTGSLSSHSERFSDDQGLSNHNLQSPVTTPKAVPIENRDDNLKILSEKLSEALLEVRSKEDLAKQHGKVAEEAVTGWERAENEVSILKRQVEVLTQKNSFIEERADQLDGALKECLQELRLAREDQEEKIYEVLASKTHECELEKSKLENQLIDIKSKLESAEKENSILKLKLASKSEELEMRICERDLSTDAAESASKQHLDSIKRIRKLEAECSMLKLVARKRNESESVDVEPFDTNSCSLAFDSDMGLLRSERSLRRGLVEIDLMDDFLEMERIVSLPETRSRSGTTVIYREESLKNELEEMINRNSELERNLVALEMALNNCQSQLKTSEARIKQTEAKLAELGTHLNLVIEEKTATEEEYESIKESLLQTQRQLFDSLEEKSILALEFEKIDVKKTEAESQLKVMELEIESLHSSVHTLENEVSRERALSREATANRKELEAELSKVKLDYKFQRSAIAEEFRINQDKELATAKITFSDCQKTIASLDRQLKSLAILDDFLFESENH